MRLPRKASLTQGSQFARVRHQGTSSVGKFLVLGTLKEPTLDSFKVGFITTRKIGKAVTRNLIRRRFRAIIQKHGDRVLPGHFIVSIARWRAPEASFAELERDWLKLAQRQGILRPSSH